MNHILAQHLDPVAKRFRIRQVCLTLAACWLLAALIGLAMLFANRFSGWYSSTIIPSAILVFLISTAIGLIMCLRYVFGKMSGYRKIATRIENEFPDLDSSLLTAIEQQPAKDNSFGYLQQEVIRNAVYHDIKHCWSNVIPGWQMLTAPIASVLSFLIVSTVLVALFFLIIPPQFDPTVTTFGNAVFSDQDLRFTIEPGNTEIEKGNSLLILARFEGRTPPNATLKYADSLGNGYQIQMTKSLDDPVFAARIPQVESALDYFVQLENQRSDVCRVDVFEYPKLKRADAKLEFPEYTKQQTKTVQDFRRISAVEGTRMSVSMMLNKSVDKATLISRGGTETPLTQSQDDPALYETEFVLNQSQRLDLHLVDTAGRQNQVPARFHIKVLPNHPPKIEMTAPAKDVQVSPLEEVLLSANVWDDFGISRAGLVYMIPGQEPVEQTFAENISAKQNHSIQHMLEFEKMNAQPDQLLSYYFWAEDIGPDGKPRRVASDMFFAEVRPFEEIFRQGQQPSANQQQQQQQQQQQGQQNAQQAGQLSELQKQIINATWKIIRREGIRDDLSQTFTEDVKLLVESQNSAINQVKNLAQQLTDPESTAHVQQVIVDMTESASQLELAQTESRPSILNSPLLSQQKAYQGLLRLRAREHQVVRNNQRQQQQQGGQQNNRSQQQLQQLQLQQDENRYQDQKLAQDEQQDPQQREDRQVLNRLRELSRRQNDLNERVKELQSALESAESEQERKEIEKQLKRLQEEQEQILRDTEELRQRMDQPENQQRMNQQAQQLDQARENIRRANEALEKGEVSRAAAEGEKAERELDELKEEFKNRTSGQFNERMKQMRQQAQELDERQDEIARDIADLNDSDKNGKQKSLQQKDDRSSLNEKIDQQKQDVDKIKQSMRKTIEEAEDVEPLLAQELYETFRRTQQSDPQKALDSTQRSLQQGWNQDAQLQEREANNSIKQMREGIENAAEKVLGDETQSLRRANQQLDRIKGELENEIRENDPNAFNEDRQSNQSRQRDQDANNDENKRSKDSNKKGNAGSDKKNDDPDKKSSASNKDGKQRDPRGKQDGKNKDGKSRAGDQKGGDSKDRKQNDDQKQSNRDPQGRQPSGDQPGSDQRNGNPQNDQPPQRPRSLRNDDPNRASDQNGRTAPRLNDWGGDDRNIAPLTGQDFLDWSDRLRDVEEMVDDPKLRAEAARIRDRAKAIRKEYQRHSKEPNWDLVRLKLFEPLEQLQQQIQDELIRKSNRKSIVPIDRDPVPAQFQDAVRRYYQEIGSGK